MSLDNEYSETIMCMILEGCTKIKIHEVTGVSISYLNRNYDVYFRPKWQKPMGHKDGPYYDSEEEMFKESVYTYESLSDSEKAIYDEMADDN